MKTSLPFKVSVAPGNHCCVHTHNIQHKNHDPQHGNRALAFVGTLVEHGGYLRPHRVALDRVLDLYDGTHDVRQVLSQVLQPGRNSHPGHDHHLDGIVGPTWHRFVRQCGCKAVSNDTQRAEAAFNTVFLERNINWAGRVWQPAGPQGWTVLRMLPFGLGQWLFPLPEQGKLHIRMRPSESWLRHDIVLDLTHEATSSEDDDRSGLGDADLHADGTPRAQLAHGDDVWFHGTMQSFGGGRFGSAHVVQCSSVHRVPDHLVAPQRWGEL